MLSIERQAIQALEEIVAEIDAGHLGRLTAIEGMPGWRDSAGTEMAREVITQARANQAAAEMLVYRWNEATAPYVPRTEHEHHRMDQLARAIKARLGRMGARLTETESGRMRLA